MIVSNTKPGSTSLPHLSPNFMQTYGRLHCIPIRPMIGFIIQNYTLYSAYFNRLVYYEHWHPARKHISPTFESKLHANVWTIQVAVHCIPIQPMIGFIIQNYTLYNPYFNRLVYYERFPQQAREHISPTFKSKLHANVWTIPFALHCIPIQPMIGFIIWNST